MIKISSVDFSAFVYGQKILHQNQTAHIQFTIGSDNHELPNLWQETVEQAFKITKFGRIGLVHERKNTAAKHWIHELNINNVSYIPAQPKRAETTPQIKTLETQVLVEMANEGLADTVEFRRLARKQLRPLKHANTDTVLFFDDILAEQKTRKILQNILGSQKKLLFPVDFFEIKGIEPNTKREIYINTTKDFDTNFVKKRAEFILKTKIAQSSFK